MEPSIINRIFWLGQATVKITSGGQTIYFDPYQIKAGDNADFVFITHSHYDHFSLDDLEKVCNENTILIAPHDCKPILENAGYKHLIVTEPGMKQTINGLSFEAVPAYNVVKTNFHPRSNNWVGYIVDVEGTRIYHAGDTERIPEMKSFHCDIALLPMGQTYTMNSVEEAVEAALDTGASMAIPIHFGMYEGTPQDSEKFREMLKDKIEVIIK